MLPFAQTEAGGGLADTIDALARTPLSKVVLFVAACTLVRVVLHPMLMRTPLHQRGAAYGLSRFINEMLDAVIYAGVFVFLLVRPFGVQTFRIPSESMVKTLLVNDFLVINKAVYRYSDPKPGDIVVFKPPIYACSKDQIDSDNQPKVDFIKRCIGAPGDKVEIRQGVLYRNDQPIEEPFRNGMNTLDFKLVQYNGEYIPVQYRDPNYNYFLDGIAHRYAVGGRREPNNPYPWQNDWKSNDELSPEDSRMLEALRDAEPARVPKGYFLMMGDNRERSFDGRAWGLVPKSDIVGRAEIIWWPIQRWQRTKSVNLGPSPTN